MNTNITAKAQMIKLAVFDVDGILSNSLIYLDNQGNELKAFHCHDGQGFKLLQQAGIEIAIISARQSQAVIHRMQGLGVKHVHLGIKNKLEVLESLTQQLGFEVAAVSYMGDDLPDLACLKYAGLAVSVPNATTPVQAQADFITDNLGGQGAVREFCDWLLKQRDQYDSCLASFL